MTELGWKSMGVLELTALPSIDKERWVSWVREAAIKVTDGGVEVVSEGHWKLLNPAS